MFTQPVKTQLFSATSLSPSPALPFHFHFDSRQVWILMSSISHLETYLAWMLLPNAEFDECNVFRETEGAGALSVRWSRMRALLIGFHLVGYWCRIGQMKYCNVILSCMLEAALTFPDKTSGEQRCFPSLCGQRGYPHQHKGFEFKDKAFIPRSGKSTEILRLSWSGCCRFLLH